MIISSSETVCNYISGMSMVAISIISCSYISDMVNISSIETVGGAASSFLCIIVNVYHHCTSII